MLLHARRTIALRLLAPTVALVLVGCGSSSTGPGAAGGDTMSALIDGVQFTASSVQVNSTGDGPLSFVGSTPTTESTVRQIGIHLSSVNGPGTFALNSASITNIATVTSTTAGTPSQWSTNVAPATGSVTVTTLTSDRVAGTFQFTAEANAGTAATGQVSITNGAFDLER